jgi:hypothetical protein
MKRYAWLPRGRYPAPYRGEGKPTADRIDDPPVAELEIDDLDESPVIEVRWVPPQLLSVTHDE